MARRPYLLTNTANSLLVNDLGFEARSVSINNYTKFPMYVNVGNESNPSRVSFTDLVSPFSNYVIDPAGAAAFAFFLDNTSDPNSIFLYPVTIVFSTGSAAAQSALNSAILAGAGSSQYLLKLSQIESANLIDLWILNDVSGTVAVDSISSTRNGAYVAAPKLNIALFQDGVTKLPYFNGSSQNVNLFTSSLATAFSALTGSLLIWVQMATAKWSDTNFYGFGYIGDNGTNALLMRSNGAGGIFFDYMTTNNTVAITPSNAWFPVLMTWNKPLNRLRTYVNGNQSGGDLAIAGVWAANPTLALAAVLNGSSNWLPGTVGIVALWTTELLPPEVLSASTAP